MRSWFAGLMVSLSLAAPAAPARDLSGEFVVPSTPFSTGFYHSVTMDERGEVLVVWGGGDTVVSGRRFDRQGTPRGDDFEVGSQFLDYFGDLAATLDRNGFAVVWSEHDNHHFQSGVYLRRFDAADRPLTEQMPLQLGATGVASDPQGNSVVVGFQGGLRFDAAGRRIGPAFPIASSAISQPQVSVDGQGNFVVVWWNLQGIFGRRFNATAKPRGPAFQVSATAQRPALAGNDGGSFVVAWPSARGVHARLYRPSGEPRTKPIQVASSFHQGVPISVAMDAAGRFLVTWSCCEGFPAAKTFGRFYGATGKPLDATFPVGLRSPDHDFRPVAAAGPAGDFLVVWNRFPAFGPGTKLGRRLAWARRGADPCVHDSGGIVCDVVHGNEPPAFAVPALVAAGLPLLGDLDGDGRDDPCLYRDGRFRCDTAHDGGGAEVEIAFGLPGDVPLLGDVDGEGRDDACVARNGQLLCDTGHNGGTAEVVVTFGTPGDRLLLGDVDADGDDDPCHARGGRLLCDTEHDGGRPETEIPFVLQPGDVALLGDVDADGRDDPCLFRGGRFLCDRTRSGALTPFGGIFRPSSGAVPLLGDINGI